jgi:hypothetical protein
LPCPLLFGLSEKQANCQFALPFSEENTNYTEAIRLNPDFNLAYFNRSAALRAMGKGFEAEQDFIRSMRPGKEPEVSLEPSIEGVPPAKATRGKQ